ncbi:hypothetical protein RvY_08127 [Ramazzottius varieornatus]|uniref:Uncharacterized protein n=1 Tax=Ramazzottius varieornatus TaxID=947166 RepID=A0A1D1V4N9_RAMVA|nr:hypothetical protein RvY_08127 [Ramazzottius varieornatus]
MRLFLKAILGPELHHIHAGPFRGHYIPTRVERYSSYVLLATRCVWILFKIYSPIWLLGAFYRHGFALDEVYAKDMGWLRPFGFVVAVAGAAVLVQGVGRRSNPQYTTFLRTFLEHRKNPTKESRLQLLKMYDFEFASLPVEYLASAPLKKPILSPMANRSMGRLGIVWKIIGYVLLKTIGRRMLYPGSLQIMKAMLMPALRDGRAKFIESRNLNTKRAKIRTFDGSFIDTLFVDNRHTLDQKGRTLVICCEGNAGFYEIGIMATPMQLQYSVLGWNHPGFGCSTGEPLPSQELHAADAVMRYAVEHLGFGEADVMVFAWSIGGYPASWLASAYPQMKGVVLDATFDDLLPLALARMPPAMSTVVKHSVRTYLNLNVAELLCQYNGPILLIRRTMDEILSVHDSEVKALVNRGDVLLKMILSHRYPQIVNQETFPLLNAWLRAEPNSKRALEAEYLKDSQSSPIHTWNSLLVETAMASPRDVVFPLDIGGKLDLDTRRKLTIYLAHLYMKDLQETHCTQLPKELFTDPWHPTRTM